MTNIPVPLFNRFPFLELLSIARTNATLAGQMPLKNCGNLRLFNAVDNNIALLMDDMFAECRQITHIDLSKNPIVEISGNFVRALPNLVEIIFNNNYYSK
jgi:Leucine-rich repeat (LRR) protein